MLEAGDRFWRLPDSFGTPPELPMPLLVELAEVVRRGRKVGLVASSQETYELARDALMLPLDDSAGGREPGRARAYAALAPGRLARPR